MSFDQEPEREETKEEYFKYIRLEMLRRHEDEIMLDLFRVQNAIKRIEEK